MHSLFFHLLLVFLPIQLGYHTWPSWAMVLGRRVDFLSPTIYLTDIFVALTVVSWLVESRKKLPAVNAKVVAAVVFAGINIFFATNRMVAGYTWLKVLEYVFLGYYITQTKPKFSVMLPYISIGVFYSSVIAIVQFVLQRSVGGPLWFLGERTFSNISPGIAQYNFCRPFSSACTLLLRAYGTFPHPNVLGGFLAILLPLIIHHAKNKKQFFYIATTALGIIALSLTFSRGAWIAFLFGVGIVNYKLWSREKIFIPLLVVLSGIIILIVSAVGVQDESVVVRGALSGSAITMFSNSPIFGKGLGNFLVELPESLPSRQIYFLQPAHNIFLLVLSEAGFVGFAIFIWLFARARKNRILIIVLLLGFIDHYFLTLQQGQLLLTILLSSTIIL